MDLETLVICEEESFYTKKIGIQNNQLKEIVGRKSPKSLSQSDYYCNRLAFACARTLQVTDLRLGHPCTLSSLFEKKRRLKKKIKTGEKVIEKITFSPIDLIANNTS